MAKRPQGEECAIILEFAENLANPPVHGGPVHDPKTKGIVVQGEECAVTSTPTARNGSKVSAPSKLRWQLAENVRQVRPGAAHRDGHQPAWLFQGVPLGHPQGPARPWLVPVTQEYRLSRPLCRSFPPGHAACLPGPDAGKGGKHLILPPGYKGEVPAGYFVGRSLSFKVLVVIRSLPVKGGVSNSALVVRAQEV